MYFTESHNDRVTEGKFGDYDSSGYILDVNSK